MRARWPDLAVLELLVAVSQGGSLGAGARAVGMAQPNASRAIARLELVLGLPLLQRSPRGSRLTANGLLIVDWARTVLESAEQLNVGAAALRSGPPATLRVAASMTVAEYLMPAWLAEFRRREPDQQVNLQVLNSTQVLEQLQSGGIQLGFIEAPSVPAGVHRTIVASDRLVVVVSPEHRWAQARAPISLVELARMPLVVREEGSGTREAADAVLSQFDPVPPAQVLNSNAAVRVSVAAGAGPAIMSELAAEPAIRSKELRRVQVSGLDAPRPLTAVWTGPRRLAGAAAELVATAVQAGPGPQGLSGRQSRTTSTSAVLPCLPT